MQVIGVTMGDPAGIGPEICLQAFLHPEIRAKIPVIFFADRVHLEQAAQVLNQRPALQSIHDISEYTDRPDVLHYVAVSTMKEPAPEGKIQAGCGKAAFHYIKIAIDWALKGDIIAIATAPINKESLKAAHIPYLDHTEIFARLTQSSEPLTLFVTGKMRIFFLTRHIALKEVANHIRALNIPEFLTRCHRYLQQLGIDRPKIALAALNPHAGEHGLFGNEEMEVLLPAVKNACAMGLNVTGPVPADSVFHLAYSGVYDAVLSLYHDQGHIAAKTLDFYRTVSYTMGLPFLRTSVDHGTAFDIARKGVANAASMVEAIKAAHQDGPKVTAWLRNPIAQAMA